MSYPAMFVTGREIDRDPNIFLRINADKAKIVKHGGIYPG